MLFILCVVILISLFFILIRLYLIKKRLSSDSYIVSSYTSMTRNRKMKKELVFFYKL